MTALDESATLDLTWGDLPMTVSTDPNPPRVPGKHALTVAVMFDASRLWTGPMSALLDRENMRSVSPPFCWWCKARTPEEVAEPCPAS